MGKFKNSFLSVEETAQLTVMLSLLIFILLTFAAAVLESASIQTSKNMRRMDVERAVESVFAEYQKELLEEYDIFGLDGTYQSGTYSEERVTDRMTVYGALSGENQVEGIRFLSDGNGQEFAEQVIRYVENRFGVDLLKELAGKEEEAQEQEAEAEDYHRQEEETEKKMDELLASGEASPEVSEEGEETENPLGILQKLKRKVLTRNWCFPRTAVSPRKVWKACREFPDGNEEQEKVACLPGKQSKVRSCILLPIFQSILEVISSQGRIIRWNMNRNI